MLAKLISKSNKDNPSYVLNNVEDKNLKTDYIKMSNIKGSNVYYPICDPHCLNNNYTKIGYNYIFNDGRCFKAVHPCHKLECLDKINEYTWPIDKDDEFMFTSCDSSFDTMQSGVIARYIRIEKGKSNHMVAISFIEAYDIFGNRIKPLIGRAFPENKDFPAKNLLKYDKNKYALTGKQDKSYIQLDLGQDYTLYTILIVTPKEYKNNILGNKVTLIRDDETITLTKYINVIQDIYIIQTSQMTESFGNRLKESFLITEFYYPDCISEGCLTMNKKTIPGYRYKFSPPDTRCFKAVNPCIDCLDNIKNDPDYNPIRDNNFISCQNDTDTRYDQICGSNVRFENVTGLKIISFACYKYNTIIPFDNISINPDKVNGYPDKLIDNDSSTSLTLLPGSYIHGIFYKSTCINKIQIVIPINDVQNIIDSKIYFTNKENIILFYYQFSNDSIFDREDNEILKISSFKIIIDKKKNSLIGQLKVIEDSYYYPSCIPYGCVSKNTPSNTITNAKYILADSRCIKALTDCSQCIEDIINNKDYSKIDDRTSSCNSEYDTRIHSVIGRYIRITGKIGFKLSDITVFSYRKKAIIMDSSSYPIFKKNNILMYSSNAYDQDLNTYAEVSDPMPNSTIDPFMQFDLGTNMIINQINLFLYDDTIINKELYVLNEIGKTVFYKKIERANIDDRYIKIFVYGDGKNLVDLPQISTTTVYSYPSCLDYGCFIKGMPIKNQQYVTDLDTCYKVNVEDPKCLPFTNLTGSQMDYCYSSCSNTSDTRYGRAYGRYIRFTVVNAVANISLKSVQMYDKQGNLINIVAYYSKGSTKSTRADNLSSQNICTISGAVNNYIQVDLGNNYYIDKLTYDGINLINQKLIIISLTKPSDLSGFINHISTLTGNTDTLYPRTNQSGFVNINLIETGVYPVCNSDTITFNDCLDKNLNTRPKFKYTFDKSNICVIANNTVCNNNNELQCLGAVKQGLMNTTDMNRYFTSCDPNIDTRFDSVNARYIRIQNNTNDGSGFNIAGLNGINNNTTIDIISKYGYPIDSKNSISNLNVANKYVSVLSSTSNNNPTSIPPYIELDLGINQTITSISFQRTGDNSLNGKKLYLIDSAGKVLYQKIIDANTTSPITIFYDPNVVMDIITLNYLFEYPACRDYGCDTFGPIPNQIYNITDKNNQKRCVKSISTNNSCLLDAYNDNLFDTNMNNCFLQCSNTNGDTRYGIISGRYVHILNTTSNTIKISNITIYNNDTILQIKNTFSYKPADNKYSNYINIPDKYAAVLADGYIEVDLGSNNNITKISISVPPDTIIGTLKNSKLRIVDNSNKIVHLSDVITNSVGSSILIYLTKNQDGKTSAPIKNSFDYNSCINDNDLKDCVTSDNKPKIGFTYNITSDPTPYRCVKTESKCDVDNCMNSYFNELLSSSDINRTFSSCSATNDTRYKALSGRYIRIESGSTNGFQIKSVAAIDDLGNIISPTEIRSFPLSSTERDITSNNVVQVSSVTASNNMVNSNPFVQLDLGSDIKIKNIRFITLDNSLNNASVSLITDSGSIVYQYNLNYGSNYGNISLTPIPNTPVKPINIYNTYNYPGCRGYNSDQRECVINDTKQIDKQKYTMEDGRCLQAIGYKNISDCLSKYSSLYGQDMDLCFKSCSSSIDTRYGSLNARFIRVTKVTVNNTFMNIKNINAYNKNSAIPYTIAYAHSNPYSNNYSTRADVIISNTSSNYASSTGYIQVDLGSNKIIDRVEIIFDVIPSYNFTLDIIDDVYTNKYTSGSITSNTPSYNTQVNSNVYVPMYAIEETFNYTLGMTGFNGSLTTNNQPKPCYTYNYTNLLCKAIDGSNSGNINISLKVKSVPLQQIPSNILNNITTISYSTIRNCFNSTRSDIDTRFVHAVGNYIRIQKDTNEGFKLSAINVVGTSIQPIETIVWPQLNPVNNNAPFSVSAVSNTSGPRIPFVQMYYGSTTRNFNSISLVSDSSLVNAKVYILNNDMNVVSMSLLSSPTGSTYSVECLVLDPDINPIPLLTKKHDFVYPDCKPSCISSQSNHLINQPYNTIDGRCYLTFDTQPESTCLQKISPTGLNLDSIQMSTCFKSCSNDDDTRYPSATGRYIRLTNKGTNPLLVKYMGAVNNNGDVQGLIGHVNPLYQNYYGNNMLNNSSSGMAGTPAGGFLQIDLGNQMAIRRVKISCFNPLNVLNNSILEVIDSNLKTVYKAILTNNTLYQNDPNYYVIAAAGELVIIPIKNNQLNPITVDLSEVYSYPSCTGTTDCHDRLRGWSKPYFKYNLSDNRCITSNNICDTPSCLDNVSSYLLLAGETNRRFNSCSNSRDTRYSTVVGRYIRLRSRDPSRTNISIISIIIYDDNNNIISNNAETFLKPLDRLATYGKNIINPNNLNVTTTGSLIPVLDASTDNIYIQIDLKVDSIIGKIVINRSSINPIDNLDGTELLIANSSLSIVYSKIFAGNSLTDDGIY